MQQKNGQIGYFLFMITLECNFIEYIRKFRFVVANILWKHLGEDAKNVPMREMPNIIVRAVEILNSKLRMIAILLEKDMSTSNQKAKRLFGWTPRSVIPHVIRTAMVSLTFSINHKR